MIKAVIFDFGGVIVNDTDQITFKEISERFNIKYSLAASIASELAKAYQIKNIPEKGFWKEFAKRVGRDLPQGCENLWADTHNQNSKENFEVKEVISKLKSNGYKLAVLSNTILPHAEYNRKQKRYKGFDAVTLSCEVGLRKPGKEIYLMVTGKIGIPPENCVYVDDKSENLAPARKVGMKTILFKNAQQLKKDLMKLGVELN